MQLFRFTKKLRRSLALVGTVWICSSTNEPDESYYKLVFTDADQVEGWVKYNSEKKRSKSFFSRLQKEEKHPSC